VFWNELVIWHKGIEFPPPATIKQDAIPRVLYAGLHREHQLLYGLAKETLY
jgi:hypothetical protein